MPADTAMQLGMIGLGRMGSNLVRRLMRDGHRCVTYDRNPDVVKVLAAEGAAGAEGLAGFSGRVSDSREGRRTVLAAVDTGVPASVIAASLYERFESRDNGLFTAKVLSALRPEFGGHAEKEA